MSVKQDRTGVRTAVDLERKYNFGKTFAEMLGLINDSRDKAESANSELRDELTNKVTELWRDTEKIVAQARETVTETLGEEIKEVSDQVATIQLDAEKFNVAVEQMGKLNTKVEMKVDADEVNIAIENRLKSIDVESVTTRTGYRFDGEGLTISKSGTEITNLIDSTGMHVTRDGEEILTADKDGVNAMNLHAKTYLIIGKDEGRSRFEDYLDDRTGCFWIGG